jgi:hypothetical protein
MLRITTERVSVSQKKLRRQAARVLRLAHKYNGVDPMFTAMAVMIIPIAERFIAAYDARTQIAAPSREGRGEIAALRRSLHRWLVLLRLAEPALAARHTSKGVPDDVIAHAKGLVQDLSPSGAFASSNVPFAEALIENLSSLVGATEATWTKARGNVAAAQERQQVLRTAARDLQAHLITFRRLLLDSVGRHHTDYQTLRLPRSSDTNDEGDFTEAKDFADDGLPDEPSSDNATHDSAMVAGTTDHGLLDATHDNASDNQGLEHSGASEPRSASPQSEVLRLRVGSKHG